MEGIAQAVYIVMCLAFSTLCLGYTVYVEPKYKDVNGAKTINRDWIFGICVSVITYTAPLFFICEYLRK